MAALCYPEQLSADEIRDRQWRRLRRLCSEIAGRNRFWTERWAAAGFSPGDLTSWDQFRHLQPLTKQELVDDQNAHPPYGTNLTYPVARYARLHQTSGTTGRPMRWLDTAASWRWIEECWAQIYRIAGLERSDRLCFPFSFGPFIGFWGAFAGATQLGNFCLAAAWDEQ